MIEVRINRTDTECFDNDVLRGQKVLNKLRSAGIPAIGSICLRGVETGRLTMFFDQMFDDLVFQWDAT